RDPGGRPVPARPPGQPLGPALAVGRDRLVGEPPPEGPGGGAGRRGAVLRPPRHGPEGDPLPGRGGARIEGSGRGGAPSPAPLGGPLETASAAFPSMGAEPVSKAKSVPPRL